MALPSCQESGLCELKKVCEWLAVNKLTLNISKSNFVIFRPYQKSLNFQPVIEMFDKNTKQYIPLECKEYVQYLGIIIDCNLNWKHHINYITLNSLIIHEENTK